MINLSINDRIALTKAAAAALYLDDLSSVSAGEKSDDFAVTIRRERDVAEQRLIALLDQITSADVTSEVIYAEMLVQKDARRHAMKRGLEQRRVNTANREREKHRKAVIAAQREAKKARMRALNAIC